MSPPEGKLGHGPALTAWGSFLHLQLTCTPPRLFSS